MQMRPIADYPDFLRDESRRTGRADSIAFPEREEDVLDTLRAASRTGRPLTVQGARTGITGGAVPDGGDVISLTRMGRVTALRTAGADAFVATVQPGVVLTSLRTALDAGRFDAAGWSAESLKAAEALCAAGPFFFAPDPTETSASIGGMAACNASGARSFRYGPTRAHVEALRVALPDGSVLALRRGRERAQGRRFALRTTAGRVVEGALPSYRMPDVKNAAGYFAADNMDMIDLFIGAEGTLGIITEAELRLIRHPPVIWAVTGFLPGNAQAMRFVRAMRGEGPGGLPGGVRPAAIEFFDGRALALLRTRRAAGGPFAELPEIAAGAGAAVYVEFHAASEDEAAGAVEALAEALAACGGSEDATWTATTDRELERLHAFRHALPEAVNLLIDERRRREPGLTKLGTDMAVPDAGLEEAMAMYEAALAEEGLDSVMFGHIGSNHVHVNILPRDMGDYARGKALYERWARKVCAMGGTISAEHGVGKLKTALLAAMYGEPGIAEMRAVRRLFDPGSILNRGNLFA